LRAKFTDDSNFFVWKGWKMWTVREGKVERERVWEGKVGKDCEF